MSSVGIPTAAALLVLSVACVSAGGNSTSAKESSADFGIGLNPYEVHVDMLCSMPHTPLNMNFKGTRECTI